jgi:hypothetical protein
MMIKVDLRSTLFGKGRLAVISLTSIVRNLRNETVLLARYRINREIFP